MQSMHFQLLSFAFLNIPGKMNKIEKLFFYYSSDPSPPCCKKIFFPSRKVFSEVFSFCSKMKCSPSPKKAIFILSAFRWYEMICFPSNGFHLCWLYITANIPNVSAGLKTSIKRRKYRPKLKLISEDLFSCSHW